jgi:Na+/H+-translocating membrane pyrophosphatase
LPSARTVNASRSTGEFHHESGCIAIACGVIALLYGIFTSQQVLAPRPATQRMIEVAGAIQEGASAYLRRQYTTITIVGVVVAAIVFAFLGRCRPPASCSARSCRARPASSA